MLRHYLLTAILLQSTLAANLLSSGVFVVRILSELHLRVQYCFNMLPYPIKDPDRKCLKSGQLEIVGGTETVLDLIITNTTVEYITVEFEIVGNTERPIQRISKRIAVDGGLPAERVAVAKGILIDFVTKCTRPFYGIMCARQCFEEDGAKYVCDPHGEKVCLVGWTGKDCNTAMTGVSTEKLSSHAPILTSTSTSHKVDLSSHAPILTTTSSGRLLTKDIETTTRPKVLLVDPDVQKPSTPSPVATKQLTEKPVSAGPLSTGSTPVAHMTAVPTSTSRVTALPANSLIDHVLVLFFVAMLIGVIKYATWKMTRSVLLENWINQKRAKVFTTESSSHSLRKDVTKKSYPINVKVAEPESCYKEELALPSYTSSPQRLKKLSPAGDIILNVESRTCHEIDSFLVQPFKNEELRLATLV